MVTLVMLVLMSVGALSLVRAVSTGRLMAANLAFRQAAVMASDAGSEAAIEWLQKEIAGASIYADLPEQGYYASAPDGLDVTGTGTTAASMAIDWDDDRCNNATTTTCLSAAPALDVDAAGNVVRYTIHRLCRSAGSPLGGANSCLMTANASGASSKRGSLSYGASSRFSNSMGVYYRITVRVRGPRNTLVFTQTLVHF